MNQMMMKNCRNKVKQQIQGDKEEDKIYLNKNQVLESNNIDT
jgi:hypothetical protein